jgi:hypothetical protein
MTEGSSYLVELGSDRRMDIDLKQKQVADLLQELDCEGLLLLDLDNFSWLTSGGMPRGLLDPSSGPALYYTPDSRFVISGNMDMQRLFDEELDGLGFQLKEWAWHRGRDQLLSDLCHNRKIACDVRFGDAVMVADRLRTSRQVLTPYEQACMGVIGQMVAHALEATCRSMPAHATEREVAAQISHRLIHRGVLPVHIGVAADGRSRTYRRFGFTSAPIERYAVLTATGKKYGLHCTASRSVCFGEPPEDFRAELSAVCRVGASYLASSWPDAVPREILLAGQRIYLTSGFEHEWQLCHQGYLTGRAAVECLFTPDSRELFCAGHALTWHASAGAAINSDTFLITEHGARTLTPSEHWPLKRIRCQGTECVRPDVLQR